MNELDQFIKHQLGCENYFRYADDFVVVHNDPVYLNETKNIIECFLWSSLGLNLHPDKIEIRKFSQGIDFLGYIILPHHIVMRQKTKKRMLKKLFKKQHLLFEGQLDEESFYQTTQSYLGILSHCNGYDLGNIVRNNFL